MLFDQLENFVSICEHRRESFCFSHALAPGLGIGCDTSLSDEIAGILARGRTGGTIRPSFVRQLYVQGVTQGTTATDAGIRIC